MRELDPAALGETEEQAQLRAVVREFFAKRGADEALWSRLAGEIGVQGLAIPEEYGGSGFSFAELAVALGEAGRALAAAPLLSTTVLAAYTLLLSDDREACRRYLPAVAAGARTMAVAGFGDPAELTATPAPGGWTPPR
jgi:acyl-CoA dehydrogenase